MLFLSYHTHEDFFEIMFLASEIGDSHSAIFQHQPEQTFFGSRFVCDTDLPGACTVATGQDIHRRYPGLAGYTRLRALHVALDAEGVDDTLI
jgi:hypothetical protein